MKKIVTLKERLFVLVVALAIVLTAVPMKALAASPSSLYWGGLRIADSTLTVYSDSNFTTTKGSIYQYEGYSVLNVVTGGFFVEYSTSSGPKQGYVKAFVDDFPCGQTGLAVVTSTTAVYAGTSTTKNPTIGSVNTGEVVCLLAKNDNWAYVEYNTTSGRKRGYMSFSNLYVYNRWDLMPDIYTYQNPGTTRYVNGTYTVYSGPSSQYATIGSISNENITVLAEVVLLTSTNSEKSSVYIEYNVAGEQRKGGFIVFDKYPGLVAELLPYVSGRWWA